MNGFAMNLILFWARLHHAMSGMSVFIVIGIVLVAVLIGWIILSTCRGGGMWDSMVEKATGRRMS